MSYGYYVVNRKVRSVITSSHDPYFEKSFIGFGLQIQVDHNHLNEDRPIFLINESLYPDLFVDATYVNRVCPDETVKAFDLAKFVALQVGKKVRLRTCGYYGKSFTTKLKQGEPYVQVIIMDNEMSQGD